MEPIGRVQKGSPRGPAAACVELASFRACVRRQDSPQPGSLSFGDVRHDTQERVSDSGKIMYIAVRSEILVKV